MPVITVDQWKQATQQISAFRQSDLLRLVTSRFEVFAQRPTKASLENLAHALKTWRLNGVLAELNTLAVAGNNLADTITHAQQTNQVINATATNVGATGFQFVQDLDGDNPLPPNQCLPPLKKTEIMRINEAIRRAKRAAMLARDTALEVARLTAWPAAPSPAQRLFKLYFGAFSQARARVVRDRYRDLLSAFSSMPDVVDHRNTDFGLDCFAATHQGHETNNVRVWLGRDFFAEGKARPSGSGNQADYASDYASTSDATVGTLIHEFSHAVFYAVDVPQIKADASGFLAGFEDAALVFGDDGYGESDDNDIQTSTRVLDQLLAAHYPDYAANNADNYGQFACEVNLLAGER